MTRVLPLVELLLDAGADPERWRHAAAPVGAGDIPVLERLVAHGADVNQPWATDGAASLYAALTWAGTSDGAHWLLQHGADPDPVFAANGETPLHVVARSWDVSLADALVSNGANVSRRSAAGRTPYAVAELAGNRAVAEWLLAHGASPELSAVDRLVASCSRGDRAAAEAMLAARPALRDEIGDEHYNVLYQAAERGDTWRSRRCWRAVSTRTALTRRSARQRSTWPQWKAGRTRFVFCSRTEHRCPRAIANSTASRSIWAAEGSRNAREGRDHAAVARLLLDAGSPVDWETGAEPAEGIVDIIAAWSEMEPAGL